MKTPEQGALPQQVSEEEIDNLPIGERQELFRLEDSIQEQILAGQLPDKEAIQRIKFLLFLASTN